MTIDAQPISEKGGANRRFACRTPVDTRARLLLVKAGILMDGHILDLSQGGCRLRTDNRFSVGIYVRVETEFYLRGLPFRLAGVSQVIVDRNTIGIRFVDMSERKKEQLMDLIAELQDGGHPADSHRAGCSP